MSRDTACWHEINKYQGEYRLTDWHPGKHLPLSSRYERLTLEEVLKRYRALACNDWLRIDCYGLADLPPIIPDCKNLYLQFVYDIDCGIFDFPDALLRIPSLESLRVPLFTLIQRIPPSFRVKHLEVHCVEAPYWLLETTNLENTLVRGSHNWLYQLQDLRQLVLQGLECRGPWKRWLTEGLYDPRLFALIRDFLL